MGTKETNILNIVEQTVSYMEYAQLLPNNTVQIMFRRSNHVLTNETNVPNPDEQTV